MSTYAIGDIHGCFTALKTIFEQKVITPNDLVVFLGDYVDRGPQTREVIDFLLEKSTSHQFEFIKGNHEIMMEVARDDEERFDEWLHFGGKETLASYNINPNPNWHEKIPATHWKFIADCKPYVELNELVFVHAGLTAGKSLQKQNRHDLFWKKYTTPVAYKAGVKVICGHTSRKNGEIANFGHTVCIDTYAYGGQWLTCLNVANGQYIKTNESGQLVEGQLGNT